MKKLQSFYTAVGGEAIIPLSISDFNQETDFLEVYQGNIRIFENTSWRLNSTGTNIILNGYFAGAKEVFTFIVLKEAMVSENAVTIQGKPIPPPLTADDDKVVAYDAATDSFKYVSMTSGEISTPDSGIADLEVKSNASELSVEFKGLCVRTWETNSLYSNHFRVYAIEKARNLKADTIELIINSYQSSQTANNPANRVPVPLKEVEDYVKFLKQQGFKILLKPHIEIDQLPYVWRANINPTDPNLWFTNYLNLMLDYAKMCERNKVEIFSVGSEYKTLTALYPGKWRELITSIRRVYQGNLTYGGNCASGNYDEVAAITFWDALDYIGADYYIVPTNSTADSMDDIRRAFYFDKMKDNSVLAIDRLSKKYGKAVLFTEYGYSVGSSPSQQIINFQKNYIDALLDIFYNKEYTNGMFIWVVDPPDSDSNTTFLADGSPVIDVIAKYYTKKSKSLLRTLEYYVTRRNVDTADRWAKLASLRLVQTYTTASATIFVESLLPNTTMQSKGTIYFRVGSDNVLTQFVELRLSIDSTIPAANVGYVINGNEVSLYLKIPQYHQYVYRVQETNAVNILDLYDFSNLEANVAVKTAVKNQNGGLATFTGDGKTSTFSILHGMGTTPQRVSLTSASYTAADNHFISVTNSSLNITFYRAPITGEVIRFYWEAIL